MDKELEETINFVDSRLRKLNIDPDDLENYYCYAATNAAGVYRYVPKGKSHMVCKGIEAVEVARALITIKKGYNSLIIAQNKQKVLTKK